MGTASPAEEAKPESDVIQTKYKKLDGPKILKDKKIDLKQFEKPKKKPKDEKKAYYEALQFRTKKRQPKSRKPWKRKREPKTCFPKRGAYRGRNPKTDPRNS